jgi:hypothetical protein
LSEEEALSPPEELPPTPDTLAEGFVDDVTTDPPLALPPVLGLVEFMQVSVPLPTVKRLVDPPVTYVPESAIASRYCVPAAMFTCQS